MNLEHFFEAHPKVALAFSGGVDSSYLLYAALHYGATVRAYYVKSPFQPAFEWEDAKAVVAELGADLTVIERDVLTVPEVSTNPENRCYYCKSAIFSAIQDRARRDGYETLIDGTNASDEASDRPGMKALEELSVLSPLRLSGLTKEEVRKRSRGAGLFTWNKPAYACLATRIPSGVAIDEKKLEAVEASEDVLFSLGFTDFRVRLMGDTAKIQLPASQFERLLIHREEVLLSLEKFYRHVVLDLEARGD